MSDAPAAGRRAADVAAAPAAAGSVGRRAADGSELGGGRMDAPQGWGEPASGIGRRPAIESVGGSGAVVVDDGAEGDKMWTRNKFAGRGEAGVVAQESADDATTTAQAAAAPRNVAGRRVQTLQELAQQENASRIGGAAAAVRGRDGAQAGVDLSLLTAALSPPDALHEPDTPWQFDRVLQQLSQDLAKEQELREEEEKKS